MHVHDLAASTAYAYKSTSTVVKGIDVFVENIAVDSYADLESCLSYTLVCTGSSFCLVC